MVGRTLSHYKVLEELRRSGMGIVYRGLDLKLYRKVALRNLPARAASYEIDGDTDRDRVEEAKRKLGMT